MFKLQVLQVVKLLINTTELQNFSSLSVSTRSFQQIVKGTYVCCLARLHKAYSIFLAWSARHVT